MEFLINCLIIFLVRVFDVTLGTTCTVMIVKGKREIGSILGFINVIIWFLVVRQALTMETKTIFETMAVAIAYAGGYGIGTYAGSWVEEKLAIGSSSINVITKGLRYDLVNTLRDKGFGVSTLVVQGKDSENLMILIEVNRKKLNDAHNVIKAMAPDAFISITDTRKIINGYVK